MIQADVLGDALPLSTEKTPPVIISTTMADIPKPPDSGMVLSQPPPVTSPSPAIPEYLLDLSAAFSKKRADILPPHRPGFHFEIEFLPGSHLKPGPLYKLSEKEMKVCKEWLDDNLSRKFISPSKSSIFSPLFFVPKKDDFLRPCVNYGKVNYVSVKDAFPLPLIKNIMQSISGAKYFTKLDL